MEINNIEPENSPLKDYVSDIQSRSLWWIDFELSKPEDFPKTLPNCTRCGRFVGASNYGVWRDQGTYEMSEWYIYCKECV